jgi:hypothetical protein
VEADQTIKRISPLCALRFCAVTGCVYVSIVIRPEVCLSSSCMTLMSALFARRRVEYVCRHAECRIFATTPNRSSETL